MGCNSTYSAHWTDQPCQNYSYDECNCQHRKSFLQCIYTCIRKWIAKPKVWSKWKCKYACKVICLVGTYPLQLLLFCFALSPHSEGRRLILWLQWTRSILMALTRGYLKQFPSTWFSSRDTHGNYIYVVWLRSKKTMHHQSLSRGLKEVNLSVLVSHLLSQLLQPRVVDVCHAWKVTVVLETQYKSLLTFIS